MKKLILTFLVTLFFLAYTPYAFAVSASGDPVLVPGDDQITTVGTIVTGAWEGTDVGASHGGTGLTDPTDHTILIGSGSDPLTPMAVGGAGVLLIGVAANDPVWAVTTLVEGANDFVLTKGTAILDVDAPLQITGTGAIITGVDQANTLSMAENLTIVDGQDIDLHGSGGEKAQLAIDTQNAERTLNMSANLTVESIAVVSQDYSSDASPTFSDLALEGGDLSIGTSNVAYAGTIALHDADAGDGYTTSIRCHADLGASYTLTLPADDGTASQLLQTDGSGVLTWASGGGGSWGSSVPVIIDAAGLTATIGLSSFCIIRGNVDDEADDCVEIASSAGVGDVVVCASDTGDTITMKDGTYLRLQADFIMDDVADKLTLLCTTAGANDTFDEISRASNG